MLAKLKEAEDRMDWDRAKAYLDMMISEYESLGVSGLFGLIVVLYPLKRRLDSGERTLDLYERIMEIE